MEKVLTLTVKVGPTIDMGQGPRGHLRVIPIVGGTFEGALSGEVLSFGADWNTVLPDGLNHVHARYGLRTADGVNIAIENEGYLHAGWNNGDVCTHPRFQTAWGIGLDWLMTGVFVGRLHVLPPAESAVRIEVFRV